MSSFTKQSIINCTISLAEQKPLNKITINDIVNACGITRNTFYYYFHDIYDVFDQTISQEIDKLAKVAPGEYDKKLFDIIEFVVTYKRVWKNLYRTLGQETLSKYVIGRLHTIFVGYIRNKLGNETISDRDIGIITSFYEEALSGVLSRWIRGESEGNTPEEMHEIIERIRVLFDGSLNLLLENSRKK